MARKLQTHGNDARPAAAGEASTSAAAAWFARRDAGLTAEDERDFARWLEADPEHRAAFARLDAAWSTFGKPVQVGGADELLAELASRSARRRRQRAGVATATATALCAVVFFWSRPPGEGLPGAVSPTATMIVPAKKVLSDGSVVLLKPDGQIKETFTDAVRRVHLLHGEALFEVAKNQRRPFVVSAGDVDVRAIGTAFSVQLGATDVQVLVTEGTVTVQPITAPLLPATTASAGGTPPPNGVWVEAGNRVVVERAAGAGVPHVQPVAPVEIDERLAWRHPRVEFSGTPLREAVDVLNRAAGVSSGTRLVIADRALDSMRVSGIFRADNLEAFVLLLEAGFGLKAERANGLIALRKATESPE